jgi:diguanylate cyclase (GGDEF)-like protein
VLKESFGKYGKVYRVGGDEFFAILDEDTCQPDYSAALSLLKRVQDKYNTEEEPPVQLAIAYGMAEYDYSEQNPETAERLADSRMYEEKRRMKSAAVSNA